MICRVAERSGRARVCYHLKKGKDNYYFEKGKNVGLVSEKSSDVSFSVCLQKIGRKQGIIFLLQNILLQRY